jgi:hypothetical protein
MKKKNPHNPFALIRLKHGAVGWQKKGPTFHLWQFANCGPLKVKSNLMRSLALSATYQVAYRFCHSARKERLHARMPWQKVVLTCRTMTAEWPTNFFGNEFKTCCKLFITAGFSAD